MKRLIRECRKCHGDGWMRVPDTDGEDYITCTKCHGRGQTGEDVRITSLNPSGTLPITLSDGSVYHTGPNKGCQRLTFDAVAIPTQMYAAPSGVPALTPFAPAAGVCAAVLNQIPRGQAAHQRVGRKVFMETLRVSGLCDSRNAAWYMVQISIILDKAPQKQAAMPTIRDIFSHEVYGSLLNQDNTDRFSELHREYIKVLSTAAAAPMMRGFDFECDVNAPVYWSSADSTGVFTDMIHGALYVYVLGAINETYADPTTGSIITVQSRLTYRDE